MKFWLRRAGLVLLLLGISALIVWREQVWWWFEVHTGTVNEPGPYYGFFSGAGSDLGELAIIGGLVTMVRHINCHEPGCWRLGHLMADQHTRSCWRHNPDGRPKPGHIARKHAEHLARLRHHEHTERTPHDPHV